LVEGRESVMKTEFFNDT